MPKARKRSPSPVENSPVPTAPPPTQASPAAVSPKRNRLSSLFDMFYAGGAEASAKPSPVKSAIKSTSSSVSFLDKKYFVSRFRSIRRMRCHDGSSSPSSPCLYRCTQREEENLLWRAAGSTSFTHAPQIFPPARILPSLAHQPQLATDFRSCNAIFGNDTKGAGVPL